MKKPFLFSDETENFRLPAEPAPGEAFLLRLRTGREEAVSVSLHFTGDGREEKLSVPLKAREELYDLYEILLPGIRRRGEYYFTASDALGRIRYLGQNGIREVLPECMPFTVLPEFRVPDWARGAVWYQIFPDRFRNGDRTNDVLEGEILDELGLSSRRADWSSPVEPVDVNRFYGGDLQGIMDKLDYLKALGIEVLYLNPVFVSPSSHKYNTQDYGHVDPHLGRIVRDTDENAAPGERYRLRVTDPENLEASDALLAELIRRAHERNMKVVLDAVFNHCSSLGKWMDKAGIYRENTGEMEYKWEIDPEFGDYFCYDPDGKVLCWWDNPSLPKLNIGGSPALRRELFGIARKWLRPPYEADGWRLDVAADLGRSPEENHRFWKDFRETVRREKPEALILAEHYGDPAPWMEGDEWDSVMNYDGFMDPVSLFFTGLNKHGDAAVPGAKGNAAAFVRAMEQAAGRLPLKAREASLCQLDNHDHARFLTRTSGKPGRLGDRTPEEAEKDTDKALLRAALLLQMTWPGAPGLYYGDEAGLCGFTDPDNRRPFPWGREDEALQDFCENAIRLHRRYKALQRGSLMILEAEQDLLVYGRYLGEEALLVLIHTGREARSLSLRAEALCGRRPRRLIRRLASDISGYNAGSKETETAEDCPALSLAPESAEVYELQW